MIFYLWLWVPLNFDVETFHCCCHLSISFCRICNFISPNTVNWVKGISKVEDVVLVKPSTNSLPLIPMCHCIHIKTIDAFLDCKIFYSVLIRYKMGWSGYYCFQSLNGTVCFLYWSILILWVLLLFHPYRQYFDLIIWEAVGSHLLGRLRPLLCNFFSQRKAHNFKLLLDKQYFFFNF